MARNRKGMMGQDYVMDDEEDDYEDESADSTILGRETPDLLKKPKKDDTEGLTWWDKVAGGKESPGPLAKGYEKGKAEKSESGTAYATETPKGAMEDLGVPGEDEFTKGLNLSSKSKSKSSGGSSSFARAFAKARLDAKAAGKDPDKAIFTWGKDKKKYNTRLA
jgi:hypothetical protein